MIWWLKCINLLCSNTDLQLIIPIVTRSPSCKLEYLGINSLATEKRSEYHKLGVHRQIENLLFFHFIYHFGGIWKLSSFWISTIHTWSPCITYWVIVFYNGTWKIDYKSNITIHHKIWWNHAGFIICENLEWKTVVTIFSSGLIRFVIGWKKNHLCNHFKQQVSLTLTERGQLEHLSLKKKEICIRFLGEIYSTCVTR